MTHYRSLLMIVVFLSLLPGCSTSTINHHVVGNTPPLCSQDQTDKKVAVYWGTAWRADQKEVATREKYIANGINKFFGTNNCFETVTISKKVAGKDALLASDSELISAGKATGADKVLKFRFEELGPNLYLYLSPILWQTENKIMLQLRVLNVRTNSVESDLSSHWQRGGAFTLHGASSLPTDLSNMLKAIFYGKE